MEKTGQTVGMTSSSTPALCELEFSNTRRRALFK